jgi:hypothetical protein
LGYLHGTDVSEQGSGDTYQGAALAFHVGMLWPDTLEKLSPVGMGVSARVHIFDEGLTLPEVGTNGFIAIEPNGPIGFFISYGMLFGITHLDELDLTATAFGQLGAFYAMSTKKAKLRDIRDFVSLAVSAEATWFAGHEEQIDMLGVFLGVGGLGGLW